MRYGISLGRLPLNQSTIMALPVRECVFVSEEQTDFLLDIREDQVEAELSSAVANHNNNNNCNKHNFSKGGKFKSRALLYQFARLFPSRHRCFFHVTSIGHIFLAVALLVTIPKYAETSSRVGGDNFSAFFFVMAITTTFLVILMGLRKFWDSTFSIYSKLATRNILRDSILFTLSVLGVSLCCEPGRVPCHLQDGLFFLCIPFSIVYMTVKKKREKVNNSTKLIGQLTAFMALVFIATVPMLAYRFSCRGHDVSSFIREQSDVDGRPVWILAYIIFIGFLSCSVCGFWSCIQDHEDSCSHSLEWTCWFHVFGFASLLSLFWINIVPFVGAADGLEDFFYKLTSPWNCHFSNTCLTISKLGFLVPALWLFFLYISNMLVYRFQSNPIYVVCNACLAIPLLSIFYSLFYFDHLGVHTRTTLSLGSLITMVTFPIAYVVLSCYHSASVVFNLLDSFDIY